MTILNIIYIRMSQFLQSVQHMFAITYISNLFQGHVLSDGQPIRDVNFVLFSAVLDPKDVDGCDKSAIKGFPLAKKQPIICHVKSQEDGHFTFPSLPVGNYKLVC